VDHFVRVGVLGHVGRFSSVDRSVYPRGSRVICRTTRGLELGQVLNQSENQGDDDGSMLRRVTVQDELLLARLNKSKSEAVQHCCDLLDERHIDAILMDVEHLFDGQSVYFYFLGEVTSTLEALTVELAETYETSVQFRKFTETLEAGCGPDCGTDEGGCGSSSEGCSTCAVASACKKPN